MLRQASSGEPSKPDSVRMEKQAGTGNATARPVRRDARRGEERDETIGHVGSEQARAARYME